MEAADPSWRSSSVTRRESAAVFPGAAIGVSTDAPGPPWADHVDVYRLGTGQLVFEDRREAGRLLAPALKDLELQHAVVVGLARGGVVVAAEIARALGLALDALAVRKVGHPLQPEYGIGAVTPGGGVYVRSPNELSEEELAAVIARAQAQAEELDRRLHPRPAPRLEGKTCLLVDDGLATGATMTAASRWARGQGAARIIAAVPVGAPETLAELESEVDQVICLETPAFLGAIGFWYEDFGQVSDAEVVALLEANATQLGRAEQAVAIRIDGAELAGDLVIPAQAVGLVLFAHGSGSSRRSPRNIQVARALNEKGIGTLLFDLLTLDEELERANVFDIPLLASRLLVATRFAESVPETIGLPFGYFGASTGAAAALWGAAEVGAGVRAVVCRGGRPDLAESRLPAVTAPTLLIVGGEDDVVLELNRAAATRLRCEHEIVVVPGATHLFEEPGALERVAELAADWFLRHLPARAASAPKEAAGRSTPVAGRPGHAADSPGEPELVRTGPGSVEAATVASPSPGLRLRFITLYVRDQDAALDFYVGKLGFEKRDDSVAGAGFRWLEVAPPGAQVSLILLKPLPETMGQEWAEWAEGLIGQATGIVLETPDIEGVYETLSARGVRFTLHPTPRAWGGSQAQLVDQDGNRFLLVQS